MNQLQKSDSTLPVFLSEELTLSPEGKELRIREDAEDFLPILDELVQMFNLVDILEKIEEDSRYVMEVPVEFRNALRNGDLKLMQNRSTGVRWPELVKIGENGKPMIVSPLPCAEQDYVKGNPIQEYALSYHNMIMAQQMADLKTLVEDTFSTVKSIEHGQMDDRIGLLEAGKNGLMLALSMPEGPERTMQIDSSRQNLLVAQAQIGETLKRKATEFTPLPGTGLECFMKELVHKGYLEGKDEEVNQLQSYYDLYLQTTKFLATSYACFGNVETAENTFRLSEKFMDGIDFSSVETIGNIHKGIGELFCFHPTEYIEAEKTVCLEDAKQYDMLALEVSGKKLLEVVNHDRTESVS